MKSHIVTNTDGEPTPEQADRVRRPADFLLAIAGFAALVALCVAIHALPAGSSEFSKDVTRALQHIPHWFSLGVELAALVASFVVIFLAINTLLRGDPLGLLDAGTAGAFAAGAALVASLIWNGERGEFFRVVLHGSNSSRFVYDCGYVAFLTASDLVRRGRWTRWCVLSGAALYAFDLASRALAPLALPISLVGGLLIGWLIRWALGVASTRPSAARIAALLAPSDVELLGLEVVPSIGPWLVGRTGDGTRVEVHLADRDTRGAGMARRLWSFVRLRSLAGGRPAFSSRARLERAALSCLLARERDVLVPRVLALSELESETMALVTTIPDGRHPGEREAPDDIGKLFAALRALHQARVAHRDLRPENLLLTENAGGFSSLRSAQPGASELLCRLDVAQLMTTAARCSSPATAIKALREAYLPADEAAIAAVLQPIALSPWGWQEMRAARGCIAEMRKELVGPESDLPQLSLERFRLRTVFTALALIAAAFILVGQLSKVDLPGALSHANPWWCLVAVVASAVTYLAAAENLAAFVPKRLSVVRGFAVQLSTAFVGVAMPPTVGHVAVNSRYLHRQGVDQNSIAAAVALSQIVNVVTTVLLLLVIGTLTGSGVSHFKVAPSGTLLSALAAVAVLVGLLLAIPRTRSLITRNLWPHLRSIWPRLIKALSDPARLGFCALANLVLTAAYVLAFVAAIRAVGGHPAILPTAAVYLAGNAVGSAAPTPGGVGAVEAVLSAGLSAIGIPVHEAIPAVLVFRLATFWLPIPTGWVSYELLQRKGVL